MPTFTIYRQPRLYTILISTLCSVPCGISTLMRGEGLMIYARHYNRNQRALSYGDSGDSGDGWINMSRHFAELLNWSLRTVTGSSNF